MNVGLGLLLPAAPECRGSQVDIDASDKHGAPTPEPLSMSLGDFASLEPVSPMTLEHQNSNDQVAWTEEPGGSCLTSTWR
jgi:hypothetical protein